MYKKRDKVRIKRIVLDLHDVIADSKKVVVFEYEMPLLSDSSILSRNADGPKSDFANFFAVEK